MKKYKPKILIYDVETSYVLARVWSTGEQYISHDQIVEGDKFDVICLAYKWLGEKEIHTLDWDIKKQDSSKMIKEFTKVIESADIPIGHNAQSFDMKKINTQRWLHGQPPIMWPSHVDTLKMLRKHFALPSNKLDYVSKILFGEGKSPMSFSDWVDIKERKDPAALEKMLKYNKKDVLLTEKLFKKIRPWIAMPKVTIPSSYKECPSCFSTKSKSKGRQVRAKSFMQIRVCLACGHHFAGRKLMEAEIL